MLFQLELFPKNKALVGKLAKPSNNNLIPYIKLMSFGWDEWKQTYIYREYSPGYSLFFNISKIAFFFSEIHQMPH